MPEQEPSGQPTAPEPSPVQAEAAPATDATPQAPAPLPEKLSGKSAEEITAQYLELEKKLGEQGRELGELRARVPQYQPQPTPYYQPVQPIQPPRFEFDYGKPEESVERIVEARLERERQERAYYEVSRQETEAQLNYNAGKDVAVKSNPRLFEGIERETEAGVQMAYRNYGLHPSLLRDPKTWERVAQNIRLERGEFDRLQKPSVQPPQPSHSAVPNQTRASAQVGVELDDDARQLAKVLGVSEKDAKEIIEKEAGLSGRGR